ncbi:MAG TPA: histidine kinase dimerization/phospho-acceptor domain-containing protein [Longimicrobiales bacterium]
MDETRWAHALRLVRSVRHDANNPLTAALGHVQLLLEDPTLTDPDVRETLGVVESELRRLAEVLRRLSAVQDFGPAGGPATPEPS